jgi:DNA-binding transcriptional ArsR family regulator
MIQRREIDVHMIGKRPYYHAGVPSLGLLPLTRLLRTEPIAGDILRILNRNGALSIQDLSKCLDVDRKTIRRHVTRMQDAGVLDLSPSRLARFRVHSLPLDLKQIMEDPGLDRPLEADRLRNDP